MHLIPFIRMLNSVNALVLGFWNWILQFFLKTPLLFPLESKRDFAFHHLVYKLYFLLIAISFCCKLCLLELVFLSYQRIFQWVIVPHLTILHLEYDMVFLLRQYKHIYVEFLEELQLHPEQSYLVSFIASSSLSVKRT